MDERIANHDPRACDQCIEYAGRRWRTPYASARNGTRDWWETNYRLALVAHARYFGVPDERPTRQRYAATYVRLGDARVDAALAGMTDYMRESFPDAEKIVLEAFAADHDATTCATCTSYHEFVATKGQRGWATDRLIRDLTQWRHPQVVHVEVAEGRWT